MSNSSYSTQSSLKRQHEGDETDRMTKYSKKFGDVTQSKMAAAHSETGVCSSDIRHLFRTVPRSQFDQKFPFFRKREQQGCFSQDSERRFQSDKSQMRYYVPPKDPNNVGFDLNHGYKDLIRKNDNIKEYLDDMLKWIMNNEIKFHLQSQKGENNDIQSKISSLHTDFVCWRGLLTRLLCTPYENREGWIIAVTLFRGTFYLCEFETEERKRQRETTTEKQDIMCYGGWKFEQYLTSDAPGGSTQTDIPVNNKEGFCSVVRTRLEKHSLVFGGEVDCVDPSMETGNKYVELKTSREMETRRQWENFLRFKLIKWWAQSFLIGIERVVAGFRDDDSIVRRLESYSTKDMPNMAKKDLRDPWQPAVCFNFMNKFLDFIKTTVTEDNPSVVYVCRWRARQDVTCEKMAAGSEFVFLPDWFVNWDAWNTEHKEQT